MTKKTLADLEEIIKTIDPHGKMNGVSYEKTSNNTLGFGNSPSTYHIAIPYPTFPPGDKSTWKTPEGVSILQEAFKDVLNGGAASLLKDSDNNVPHDISGTFFIDISHLQGRFGNWFTQKANTDGHTVADKIVDIVNGLEKYPNVKPVIRFLQGLWGDNLDKVGQKAWDAGEIKQDIQAVFWNGDKPRIDNPNAEIYLGLYGPDFSPKKDELNKTKEAQDFEKPAKEAAAWLRKLIDEWEGMLATFGAGGVLDAAKKWDAKRMVDSLLSKELQSVSWNHGKILAVNGTHLMTGGANYWGDYEIGHGDVYDTSTKIQGSAALSAHKYLDYFWDYLQGELGTDGRSHLRMGKLNKNFPDAWTVRNDKTIVPVPLFFVTTDKTTNPPTISKTSVPAVDNKGDKTVLTVAKLGDWHGEMTNIRYPVQMIDALRDLAVNVVWHLTHQIGGAGDGPVEKAKETEHGFFDTLWDLAGRLKDTGIRTAAIKSLWDFVESVKDTAVLDTLGEMQIQPAAWASRHVRVEAIAAAKSTVRMSVEHLVYYDLVKQDEWQKVMTEVNNMTAGIHKVKPESLDEKSKWNGWLWPYDLLFAWAKCIDNGAKVQVIVTKFDQNGGYGDPVHLETQKTRVAEVLAAFRHYTSAWDPGYAKSLVDKNFEIVRLRDDDGKINHSKVVCVDDELLYIGSDNAYTSFNEEHGVWIDDETAINAWKKGYWDTLWEQSQHKKAA